MDSEEKRRKKEAKAAPPIIDYNRSDDAISQRSIPSSQALYPNRPRGYDTQSYISGDDVRSYMSEDEYYPEDYSAYDDTTSEVYAPSHNMFRESETKKMLDDKDIEEEEIEEPKTSPARRKWVFLTWLLTWWVPPCFLKWCGGMKRKDIQMAWREKVALYFSSRPLSFL